MSQFIGDLTPGCVNSFWLLKFAKFWFLHRNFFFTFHIVFIFVYANFLDLTKRVLFFIYASSKKEIEEKETTWRFVCVSLYCFLLKLYFVITNRVAVASNFMIMIDVLFCFCFFFPFKDSYSCGNVLWLIFNRFNDHYYKKAANNRIKSFIIDQLMIICTHTTNIHVNRWHGRYDRCIRDFFEFIIYIAKFSYFVMWFISSSAIYSENCASTS